MCAIFGSFNVDKMKELAVLNSYRGSFSHSFTEFNLEKGISNMCKGFGPVNTDGLKQKDNTFYIAHIQAPTGGMVDDFNRIHPATRGSKLLWHNGILKQSYLRDSGYSGWDTQYLIDVVVDWDILGSIDGSFSCLMIENKDLHLFRSQAAPMFFDDELNLSSTKFEGSTSTKEGIVYKVDLENKSLSEIKTFQSKSNPYYLVNQ